MIPRRELFAVQQLLLVIAEGQIGLPLPLPAVVETALQNRDSQDPLEEGVLAWIALLDYCAAPALLRTAVTDINPSEAALAALLRYFYRKEKRSDADRERGDWLITYIFKERQRDGVFTGNIEEELPEILPAVSAGRLRHDTEGLLGGFPSVLAQVSRFRTFEELNRSGVIAEGRALKKELHDEFFHPRVLAAVVNYNLRLGQKFDALFAETAASIGRLGALLAQKDYHLTAADFAKIRAPAAPIAAEPPAAALTPLPTRDPVAFDPAVLDPAIYDAGKVDLSVPDPAPVAPGVLDSGILMMSASLAPAASAGEPAPPQKAVDDFDDRDLVRQQMKEMGLDPLQQSVKIEALLARVVQTIRKAGDKIPTQIPLTNCSVPVQEWEIRAVMNMFPESDKSFRAEFNRQIRRAFGIRAAVAEEWVMYDRKQGSTDYLWKAHYDTLVWLLFEGRHAFEGLGRFAKQSTDRGLVERAEQVRQSAAKLEESLTQLAKIF